MKTTALLLLIVAATPSVGSAATFVQPYGKRWLNSDYLGQMSDPDAVPLPDGGGVLQCREVIKDLHNDGRWGILLSKITPNGISITNYFYPISQPAFDAVNASPRCSMVLSHNESFVLIAAAKHDYDAREVVVLKVRISDGAVIWAKTVALADYLPDPFDPVLEFQELERAVIVRSYDQSGGASGYTVIAAGTLDRLAAFKVDSSGALLWQRLFDIPNRVSSTFVQRLSTGDAFSYLNQVYVSATVTETRPSVGADMGYAVVYGLSADTGGLFGTATYTTNEDDQSLTSTHLTPDYAPGTTILRGYYLSTNRSRLVTPPQPPYYIPYFETMDPLVIRASLSAAFGGIVWNKRIPGSTGIEGIHTTNVALKVLANRPTAFANVDELSLYTATGNLMTGRSIGMGFADRISFNPGNDMNLISISAFAGSTTELGLVTTFENGNVAPCGFTSSYATVDRTVLWSSQLPSQRLVLPYAGSEAVSMELHSASVIDTCP